MTAIDPVCGAPRGAVWQYPKYTRKETTNKTVGSAVNLITAEANPAGGR